MPVNIIRWSSNLFAFSDLKLHGIMIKATLAEYFRLISGHVDQCLTQKSRDEKKTGDELLPITKPILFFIAHQPEKRWHFLILRQFKYNEHGAVSLNKATYGNMYILPKLLDWKSDGLES